MRLLLHFSSTLLAARSRSPSLSSSRSSLVGGRGRVRLGQLEVTTRSPTGSTIGGVDVGGLTADEATQARRPQSWSSRSTSRSRFSFEGASTGSAPRSSKVRADVDGMVDQALDESQEGGLPTRVVALRHRRRGRRGDRPADHLLARGASTSSSRRSPRRSTATRSTPRSSPTPTSLNPFAGQTGVAVDESKLRAQARAARFRARSGAGSRSHVDEVAPEVTPGRARRRVPDLPHRRPRRPSR